MMPIHEARQQYGFAKMMGAWVLLQGQQRTGAVTVCWMLRWELQIKNVQGSSTERPWHACRSCSHLQGRALRRGRATCRPGRGCGRGSRPSRSS